MRRITNNLSNPILRIKFSAGELTVGMAGTFSVRTGAHRRGFAAGVRALGGYNSTNRNSTG